MAKSDDYDSKNDAVTERKKRPGPPLSDITVRKAAPEGKPYKLADGKGLTILVEPTGAKRWRFRYRFAGKEKMISLGTYPEVSLSQVRQRRDEARALIAQNIDPSAKRQAEKKAKASAEANSFEAIAREWYSMKRASWAESHATRVLSRFEQDLFPRIGHLPITDLENDAPALLAAVRPIQHRGALETAHRVLWLTGQVFRYAVATGKAHRDPTADLKGALPSAKDGHFAAITDPARVAELLRAIDGYQGGRIVSAALQLAPLVFVRPGELRTARWADMDLEQALWSYRVSKTGQDHIVPLSTQAVAILRELEPFTGRSQYVFPSDRSRARPMSENAILAALRRMDFSKDEMSGHGFRAMARTLLDERLKFPPHLIEHQLAHAVRDPLGRAYNRTAHLEDRRAMMQTYSDHLETLKTGSNVVAIGQAKKTA
jgi:integrase